jgi:hypothetical protein
MDSSVQTTVPAVNNTILLVSTLGLFGLRWRAEFHPHGFRVQGREAEFYAWLLAIRVYDQVSGMDMPLGTVLLLHAEPSPCSEKAFYCGVAHHMG